MAIRIQQVRDIDQLSDSVRSQWSQLPIPSPMQTVDWTINWWKTFSKHGNDQLCILLVFDDDLLIAVAPWYLSRSWNLINCLRFLGDGITCSDHSAVIVRAQYERQASDALAGWLHEQAGKTWHTIQFESVHRENRLVKQLLDELGANGCEQKDRDVAGCWTVDLPATWDDYLGSLSRNHRKRCRRWQRSYFDSGRAVVERLPTSEFAEGWREIARMNHLRREQLGDRSAFADERFHQFHLTVLPGLLSSGQAEIRLLRIDGKLTAAEYVLLNDSTVFCYQSGMETSTERDGYGNLSILALMRDAIDRGYKQVDLLRGDEDYKLHWGARRLDCVNYFVASKSIKGSAQVVYNRTVDWARAVRSLVGIGFDRGCA